MLTKGSLKVAGYNIGDREGSWEEFKAMEPKSEEIASNEDLIYAVISSSEVYMQPATGKDGSWVWSIKGDPVE